MTFVTSKERISREKIKLQTTFRIVDVSCEKTTTLRKYDLLLLIENIRLISEERATFFNSTKLNFGRKVDICRPN